MGRKSTAINKEKFLDSFASFNFNVTKTCEHIGVGLSTYYRWVHAETGDQDFINEVRFCKQAKVDHVQSKLDQLINGFEHKIDREKVDKDGSVIPYKTTLYFPPNFQAIKLFLEAHARHLGYGMKHDDSDADQHADDE